MRGTRNLRLPMLVVGIYSVLVGIVLVFPAVAAAVFGRPTLDAAVESGWGTSILTMGLFALAIASNAKRYGPLAWISMAGLLLTAVDLAYFWATGAYTARTALAPLILNVGLSLWVWTALPKREVVATPETLHP